MLLKIIGIIVLIASGGLLGYSFCDDYIERINCLDAMKKALLILRGEIKHNNSSICEAMGNISVRNIYVMNLLKKVIHEYKNKNSSLWEAWERGIAECFEKKTGLKEEEIKIVKDFGRHLGTTDRETQLNHIDQCTRELDECIFTLKSEKKEKCKLYKVLGVLSGVFVSIMLL